MDSGDFIEFLWGVSLLLTEDRKLCPFSLPSVAMFRMAAMFGADRKIT